MSVETSEPAAAAATPRTAGATPLFEARGISKTYGHVNALMSVDFEVRRNEVVGLLGDNGAGKSTLIKILSGVVTPDRGQFFREGKPVDISTRRRSEEAGIQTIYQDIALVRSMSIMRNIYAGREPQGPLGFMRMGEMRRTAVEILDKYVRIAGITSPDLLVEELSGGQAQAVAIARAVHFKRDILLLDEPTSALSVRETEKVLAIMRELAESGVSCVFVTHNLYHAFRVCDRFAIMAHGQNVKSALKADTSLNELTDIIMTH
ncbi:MAG: ATP-binding cassette domain-containing protein [Alphaproteobacteria bacterium]